VVPDQDGYQIKKDTCRYLPGVAVDKGVHPLDGPDEVPDYLTVISQDYSLNDLSR
jgi:hypothetical protein